MDQDTVARNENSWQDSLFLDLNLLQSVDDWPGHVAPSVYINQSICKSVVVLNPKVDPANYKSTYHRDGGGVPEDVKSEIIANRITHDKLLLKADNCNINQGFWFLSCKKKNHCWDYYFAKIADHMYKIATSGKVENFHKFLKIEARWNNSANMGIIMISNLLFSSENTINETGATIEGLINRDDVIAGHVSQRLSYKPQFYLDSGFDVNFSHDFNTNIYAIDLLTKNRYSYKDEAVRNY